MTDAKPYPKSQQLSRGERRYRRKVASPKQWQAIRAEKLTSCRLTRSGCLTPGDPVELHHLVHRSVQFGDDVADNLIPLCRSCHRRITEREQIACRALIAALSDAEYAYMIERGGEDYPKRAYGISYGR